MTRQEMTEIFSVMMLAYPNAEIFKGGIGKLKPTIELWTSCTHDIDFWTGQQAVKELCKTCKYPPTIAEFREQAESFTARMDAYMDEVIRKIRNDSHLWGLQGFYDRIPENDILRAAIGDIGGPGSLIRHLSGGKEMWEFGPLQDALRRRIRGSTPLPASGRKALTEGGDQNA